MLASAGDLLVVVPDAGAVVERVWPGAVVVFVVAFVVGAAFMEPQEATVLQCQRIYAEVGLVPVVVPGAGAVVERVWPCVVVTAAGAAPCRTVTDSVLALSGAGVGAGLAPVVFAAWALVLRFAVVSAPDFWQFVSPARWQCGTTSTPGMGSSAVCACSGPVTAQRRSRDESTYNEDVREMERIRYLFQDE